MTRGDVGSDLTPAADETPLQEDSPTLDAADIAAASLPGFALTLLVVSRQEVAEAQIRTAIEEEESEFGVDFITRVCQRLKFKSRTFTTHRYRLRHHPTPFLAQMKDGMFVTVLSVDSEQVTIYNPVTNGDSTIDLDDFAAIWTRRVILIAWRPMEGLAEYLLGWRWFVAALYRYRRPLASVVVFSFFIQLSNFITPLFFQVIVDKVIVHRVPSTLDVLAIGLAGVYLFQVWLQVLRGYLFPHTTTRIDVELGTRAFGHLLRLPQPYFDARRVGDSVARMYEIENIRQFITGSALTVMVDTFFAVALISLLFFYNTLLAWIVVASLPIYALLAWFVAPYLRSLIDEKFNKGANRQSYLVEIITGIATVKAMAVERQVARRADELLAAYVKTSFNVDKTSNAFEQLAEFVSKVVLLLTLYFGAKEVMAGRLSVGELVAFNMLVSQLIQPILKLVHVWRDFQQASISLQRIGDILNSRSEVPADNAKMIVAPTLDGRISFQGVGFRYRPDGNNVLNQINLDIRAGEFIGVVGTSGSGKSTLTKLLQGLYKPNEGRIFVTDLDVSLLEPSSLRQQIGVVLQENVLFNSTVAENIAFGHPEISITDIVHSAKLSGAHDFITQLPQGYNTQIGERGASLSGGQRQRIAIARALITAPPILILDEATSALDYETERVIQDNMGEIAQGRTVIVIAHRLSTVRRADRIIVLERGEIQEIGTHDELLARNGRYAELHAIQAT